MPERLKYHFEPEKGWMNDPNGLVFYKNQYHAFFQHYPYAPKWGQMHWGHAVSNDLVHWTQKPIALYPDMPYENEGGCFSGSAIEKDGKLYLFYTSVSKEMGQTQSIAISEDGVHFEKYEKNPILHCPTDGENDFRDPKVTKIGDKYHMVVGSGKNGLGKILHYVSGDLLSWEYLGVFHTDDRSTALECPDFFPLDGKYVLTYSLMGRKTRCSAFVIGTFDGETFTPETEFMPEIGPQFYAPQTFLDDKNRRILIGWLYDWNKPLDEGADYAGALTIPRTLSIKDGVLYNLPVPEAQHLLTDSDKDVAVDRNRATICGEGFDLLYTPGNMKILRDTKTLEIFFDGGRESISYWFNK